MLDSIRHRLNHERDMSVDMATDMAIDMDVDVADDVDADIPCFHKPVLCGPNIFMVQYQNSVHFQTSAHFWPTEFCPLFIPFSKFSQISKFKPFS
jgi:hypothetical protein